MAEACSYRIPAVVVELLAAAEEVHHFLDQVDEEEAADEGDLSQGLVVEILFVLVEYFFNLKKKW